MVTNKVGIWDEFRRIVGGEGDTTAVDSMPPEDDREITDANATCTQNPVDASHDIELQDAQDAQDAQDPVLSMHWAPEAGQGICIVQVYRDQVPTTTDDNRPGPVEGTDEEFEIDWIGGIGKRGRQWVVNVKWQGYPCDEMTWESLKSIPKSVVDDMFAEHGRPAEMKRDRVASDTSEVAVGSQDTTGTVAESSKRPLETALAGRPSKRRRE